MGTALILDKRVIVDVFSEQARSYTHTSLFQIEAVKASICVWRRLRPDSNSLMKD